jgi:Terminase RNaseH-like domain
MPSVYMITREDGLSYIGTSVDVPRRVREHERTARFSDGISAIQELFVSADYDACLEAERALIRDYDTHESGLNLTPTGGALHHGEKFSTLGHRFSSDSRAKMSQSAKRRTNRPSWVPSPETRLKWSRMRRGKCHARKIDPCIVWKDFLSIKHTLIPRTARNGRTLSQERLFAKKFSYQYGMTPNGIVRILKKPFRVRNNRYSIQTPSGWQKFEGIQATLGKAISILFSDGSTLVCSPKHVFIEDNREVVAETIVPGMVSKKGTVVSVTPISSIRLYDPLNVAGGNVYETEGMVSHNCEFLGSTNTLISSTTLQRLVWKEPLQKSNNTDILEVPEEGHSYIITVDTSLGAGLDYSVFVVFDITQVPYKMVAKYRSNTISPLTFPNLIYNAARIYNNALILVETNDVGGQVANILHFDLEYDGTIWTRATPGKTGTAASDGFGGVKLTLGMRQTKSTKRVGCANLKAIIEQNKLLITDYDLLYELFRFVEKNGSYQAEGDEHDDIVMCCVIFAWLVNQPYFKEMTQTDARAALVESTQEALNSDMVPFGFIDDGSSEYVQEEGEDDFMRDDFDFNRFDRMKYPIASTHGAGKKVRDRN